MMIMIMVMIMTMIIIINYVTLIHVYRLTYCVVYEVENFY